MDKNLFIDLFWSYLGPKTARKFGPRGPFSHTWKYPKYAYKPNFLVSYGKLFEEMAKNLQKFHITYFCNQRLIKKLEAKNQNSIPTTF